MLREKVLIVHQSLNSCGGAEFLTLKLCEALKGNGFHIGLVVSEKTNWIKVSKIFGVEKNVIDEEFVTPPFRILPTIYSNLIHYAFRDLSSLPKIKNNFNPSISIVTYPLSPIASFADIVYMHFPYFIPGMLETYYPKYGLGVWRLYATPYKTFYSRLIRKFKTLEKKPLLLTNSRFSAKTIEKHLGFTPITVYPPVEVKKYLPLANKRREKNYVITISRIEEAKNLEIIPEIAKNVKDGKFIIIGSLGSEAYLRRLLKTARSLNVKERVMLLPNASEEAKMKVLSEAKVYLHTMKYEHFGIAIVESMSAGLVPLMHKSGGPWIDILNKKQGVFGYAYRNSEEAAVTISELLNSENLRIQLSEKAVEQAKSFDSGIFERNMLKIVREFIGRNNEYSSHVFV